MGRPTGKAIVTALAAGALLLAGCGDSDDSAVSRPTPAPEPGQGSKYQREKADYIEETDGYCRRLRRRIRKEVRPYVLKAPSSPKASAEFVRVLKPRMEFEIRRVRSIVLPERDVETVLHFLDVWGDVLKRAERDPVAFVRATSPFAESEKLARQYGFKVCGSP